jgi:hypothetical protein
VTTQKAVNLAHLRIKERPMTFATNTTIRAEEGEPSKLDDRNARHHAQLLASVVDGPMSGDIGSVHALPPIRGPPNIHEDAFLDRRELSAALTEAGLRISEATLATKAVRGGGPPYQLFGRKPLYRWGTSLKWALSRLSRPVTNTSEARAG